MKLVANHVNEAVLSNVAEIGEFRIRNSAKAFSILSSGLYANKIKAIIRELSCNAFDSHVAAGKKDVPFDVHLPGALEPWFAVRDYGTGLDHDQVCNIYTTYFESTKTNSNDFVGALGLGSKSPFSYTDNFSVTAVKDGMKRIYSAFINEQGVPSIALLMEESSDETNGVEVKFSVENRHDFYKFEDEAQSVYKYFKLKPVISGRSFNFSTIHYETKDVVPGIHITTERYQSMAIMGNIAYPIDVPNSQENLGTLANLLNCGIHIEFDIGELDFQASREGLSYIPETIAAIKRKLELLNDSLEDYIANSVNNIENAWDRAIALSDFQRNQTWVAAVSRYVSNNNFALMEQYGYTHRLKTFEIPIDYVTAYNIKLRSFGKSYGRSQLWTNAPRSTAAGIKYWQIPVNANSYFVVNDGKIGILQRSMNHFKSRDMVSMVYVIDAIDPTLPINVDGFMQLLHNPPKIMKASELDEKPRKNRNKTKLTSILLLTDQGWRSAGTLDNSGTYYYLPLSGHKLVTKYIQMDPSSLPRLASDIKKLAQVDVYGVRKQDMQTIEGQSNWINLEDHIISVISDLPDHYAINLMAELVDNKSYLQYNGKLDKLIDKTSPYSVFINKYKNAKGDASIGALQRLINHYSIKTDITTKLEEMKAELANINCRYPLLEHLRIWLVEPTDIAQYINAIDKFI
jgi:hypothetical protein